MPITSHTIQKGTIGRPHFVAARSLVAITPGASGSAKLEYTTADIAGIRNGTAIWVSWPKGAVSSPAQDLFNESGYVRVSPLGADATLQIYDELTPAQKDQYTQDWGAPVMALADQSTGSVSGIQTVSGTIPLRKNQLTGSVYGAGGSTLPASTNSVESGSQITVYPFALSAWGPFNAVQLVCANHTNVAVTVDNAIVGTSATAYPGGVFNIALPSSLWGAQSGAWSIPAAQGSSPAIRQKQPGYGISPKLKARSIPRAAGEPDGGKYELIFGRILHNAGNSTITYGGLGTNFPSLYDPNNEGFSLLIGDPLYGYDIVADPTAWTTAIRSVTPGVALVGVIFSYDQKMTMVAGPGDSVYTGLSTAGDSFAFSHLFKATARIRATGKMVSYFNGGISGSTMQQINVRGRAFVDMGFIDIMPLHSFTINGAIEGQTIADAADWDNQWYFLQDLIQYHLAKKSSNQVLLLTPLPNNSYSTAQNTLRLKQRDRVMNSGFPFVDMESLCDAAGKWAVPAYTSDGGHTTPAGNEAMSAIIQPALNSLVP